MPVAYACSDRRTWYRWWWVAKDRTDVAQWRLPWYIPYATLLRSSGSGVPELSFLACVPTCRTNAVDRLGLSHTSAHVTKKKVLL